MMVQKGLVLALSTLVVTSGAFLSPLSLPKAKVLWNNCCLHGSSRISDDGDDGNAGFYEDLRRAAIEKLGEFIPYDDDVAANAENEFLASMKSVSKQFEEIKAEQGSDAACDHMMQQIRIADEEQEKEKQKLRQKDLESDNEETAFQ